MLTGGPTRPSMSATPGPLTNSAADFKQIDNQITAQNPTWNTWNQQKAEQGALALSPEIAAQLGANSSLMQSLLGQMLGVQATYGYQSGLASGQYGLDLQGLGLQEALLGLDRGDLASKLGFLGQREGLLGRRESLADALLQNRLAGFGIDEESARLAAAADIRGIENEATGAGAWFAPERRLATNDVNQSLDQRLRQIDLARSDAELSRQGQDIDFDEARLRFSEDRSGIASAQDRLGIEAQKLGLSREQLAFDLQKVMEGLGIDAAQQQLLLQGQLGQAEAQGGALMMQLAELAKQIKTDPTLSELFGLR